jgi:MFS family permease
MPFFSAIANVLGVVLGGVLLLASWHWIFWSIAIICIPLSVVSAFFTPSTTGLGGTGRTPKFDYLGTFLMISSFVLVIFGMTQGNIGGW